MNFDELLGTPILQNAAKRVFFNSDSDLWTSFVLESQRAGVWMEMYFRSYLYSYLYLYYHLYLYSQR